MQSSASPNLKSFIYLPNKQAIKSYSYMQIHKKSFTQKYNLSTIYFFILADQIEYISSKPSLILTKLTFYQPNPNH